MDCLANARTAAAIEDADLPARARGILDGELTPRAMLDRLSREGHLAEAIRFLACALPRREAVWWGCLCVWQAYRPEVSAASFPCLGLAVRWVLDPSEAARQACVQLDPTVALRTPAGALTVAVQWSGGSLTRPDLPVVPPPAYLTGRAAAHAILLAAVLREPQQYCQHYRQYLTMGREVADGKTLWTAAADQAEPAAADEHRDVLAGAIS